MEPAKKPRVIAFVNQKGGVLKTTLAAQVAYGLARSGLKVLAIDMDPQGNLTQSLGAQDWEYDEPGILKPDGTYYALDNRQLGILGTTKEQNLRLMPTSIGLVKAEMGFIGRPDSYFLLEKALDKNKPDDLDYIIIDSPPNLGLLTLNSLYSASEVIIPLTCDSYAMNGVAALMDTIQLVQEKNNHLKVTGYVPCKVDMRRTIDQQSIAKMQEVFGDKIFKAVIPESTALKVAGGLGVSIWEHDHRTLACASLSALCAEIIERDPNV